MRPNRDADPQADSCYPFAMPIRCANQWRPSVMLVRDADPGCQTALPFLDASVVPIRMLLVMPVSDAHPWCHPAVPMCGADLLC